MITYKVGMKMFDNYEVANVESGLADMPIFVYVNNVYSHEVL